MLAEVTTRHGARENRNKFSWLRISAWILDDSCRGVTNLRRNLAYFGACYVYGVCLYPFSLFSVKRSPMKIRWSLFAAVKMLNYKTTFRNLFQWLFFWNWMIIATLVESWLVNNQNWMYTDDTNYYYYMLIWIQNKRKPL